MSEQLKEALSAIVDGEASEFELRRVLDEMGKDEGLVRAWQSYHLIRQAAQGENVQGVADMGDRIWASLDADEFLEQDIVQEEPVVAAVANPPRRRWGMAGGAIAAALALGVFVAGNFNPAEEAPEGVPSIAQSVLDAPGDQGVDMSVDPRLDLEGQAGADVLTADRFGGGLQTVAATSTDLTGDDEFDYGPGFVPYSEMSPADQARSDGYFLHHVQHQAVNNDNVLSFVKMISYPQ